MAQRRLRNSGLAGRPFRHAAEVVRWHGAMQAQDYGPAAWSVGQRSTGVTSGDVDRALADGSIVRTHVLRPTWHFVSRRDVRWLLSLTAPRVQRHNDPRYRELGLDARTRARAVSVIGSTLSRGHQLTRAELGRVLEARGVDTSGQRLPYLLMHCELEAVIGSGSLSGRQYTYALLDDRVPAEGPFDRHEALVELARRYLGSHGPATIADLRWWSSLTAADCREALSGLGDEVIGEQTGDLTLWSLASEPGSRPRDGKARLLQPYDEVIVGYTESRYLGDPRADAARAVWRDRTLPNGVLLVNGRVAGRWRRTLDRGSISVEVLAYGSLGPREAKALEAEVRRLGRFHDRPVGLEVRPLDGGRWAARRG